MQHKLQFCILSKLCSHYNCKLSVDGGTRNCLSLFPVMWTAQALHHSTIQYLKSGLIIKQYLRWKLSKWSHPSSSVFIFFTFLFLSFLLISLPLAFTLQSISVPPILFSILSHSLSSYLLSLPYNHSSLILHLSLSSYFFHYLPLSSSHFLYIIFSSFFLSSSYFLSLPLSSPLYLILLLPSLPFLPPINSLYNFP